MEDAKVQAMRAHQLHQLKKEAIVYYQSNGVPLKMEDALNQMFRDRPDCVFGYLSNYFEQLALPPVLSGVRCHKSFDARGWETLAAEVTCRHRNEDRVAGRSRASLQVTVGEHDKPEEREREAQELRHHVEAALTLVNEGPLKQFAEQGFDPRDQRAIDEFLLMQLQAEEDRVKAELQRELDEAGAASGAEGSGADENASPQHQPAAAAGGKAGGSAKKRGGGKGGKEIVIVPDEPREGLFPGCLALSCLSAACAAAGASAAGVPLYRHLRQQLLADESHKDCADKDWRLPLPMLTILSGGKASPGKSNCVKEYMIVPRPGLPFDRVLRDSVAVYQQVAKTLSVKGGPAARFTNDAGALNTVIDRPEAGFDLINDALKALELTDSFDLAANIAGHELFDYEKGKYDLAQGAQKSPDETADFLDDLSAKQASLVALIDPLRRVERDAWLRLCQKASQRCLIVGDATQHRPGRLLAELQQMEAEEAETEQPPAEEGTQQQQQQQQPLLTSAWVARLQQRNTVTELFDCAKRMRSSGQVVVVAVGPSDNGDTTIVDLAVAMGARYLKLGAPVRAERIDKLQRLAEIGEELRAADLLSQWEQLSPPLVRPRGSETPEGEQQPPQQQQPASEHQPSTTKSRKGSSTASKA
ncbi:hypothetical protein BOX15_Mlig012301g3 [Macrostomum lignano]|uniref:Enolase 4 n=2 Tax=Macrostomum lignano TaxID=282301 RepID=A0A267FXI0_9PLAT|nr:hypothetical protein BOX15_Mlig012301g3 [Macrostomum lignano]